MLFIFLAKREYEDLSLRERESVTNTARQAVRRLVGLGGRQGEKQSGCLTSDPSPTTMAHPSSTVQMDRRPSLCQLPTSNSAMSVTENSDCGLIQALAQSFYDARTELSYTGNGDLDQNDPLKGSAPVVVKEKKQRVAKEKAETYRSEVSILRSRLAMNQNAPTFQQSMAKVTALTREIGCKLSLGIRDQARFQW
ncbi:hypothetical protein I350_07958 [Cryptococcus amylolentus CBS 6273]|uniref:Uncharacterized protein n=1 Tax=Cryptococcus amylolentus CBS 6273 TaxID=1296118 RepID=A0A1E3JAN1_9TREE|nr:hypothetical protein I350_07958 [Cryptococcus amylolentus CBS 6273]